VNIYYCYRYHPDTTAVYLENAFSKDHTVINITSPYMSRKGYVPTPELTQLTSNGMPAPDLAVWVDSGGGFFPRGWESLTCPTAVFLIDVHTYLDLRYSLAPFFDYIFVAQRDYIPHFEHKGFQQVFWLPLACDPNIHSSSYSEKLWDIGFVGKLNSPTRKMRLEILSSKYNMNDYKQYFSKEEISSVYGQSKIVFNSSINGDLNMRVFEALASGTLLVTDRIQNGQQELFRDGHELVEYANDQDMVDLIGYYLNHEAERKEIANNGRQLVVSQHTYQHRSQQIINQIFNHGSPNLLATVRSMDPISISRAYQRYFQQQYMVETILGILQSAWKSRKDYWYAFGQAMLVYARRMSLIYRSYPKN
jgi:hypothetical protein